MANNFHYLSFIFLLSLSVGYNPLLAKPQCERLPVQIQQQLWHSGQCSVTGSSTQIRAEVASSSSSLWQPFFWFYKNIISLQDGNRCQFSPSCSLYAYRKIRQRGIASGILLAADRLLRDHPFIQWNQIRYQSTGQLWQDE